MLPLTPVIVLVTYDPYDVVHADLPRSPLCHTHPGTFKKPVHEALEGEGISIRGVFPLTLKTAAAFWKLLVPFIIVFIVIAADKLPPEAAIHPPRHPAADYGMMDGALPKPPTGIVQRRERADVAWVLHVRGTNRP